MPSRSTVLLATIVLLLVLHPFLESFIVIRGLFELFLSVTLLAAIYGVSRRRWVFRAIGPLALVALAAGWAPYVIPRFDLPVLRYGLTVTVLSVAAVVILIDTLRQQRITVEQVAGSLVVYLLIGLVWGHLYFLLESIQPGSLGNISGLGEEERLGACVYFSYVTLTTLGYGDIMPLTSQTRSLALSEAIIGQLYLAALVARIVGIHVATGMPLRVAGNQAPRT